jgi:hypothetical protein
MADPFSTIAGVAGIAAAASSVSISLFRIASRIRSAKEDIESFAMHIGSFSAVMETAHDSLSGYALNATDPSLINQITDEEGALSLLIRQSNNTRKRIEEMPSLMRSMDSEIRIIGRIKWILQKDLVLDLKSDMDRVVAKMNLLVMSVTIKQYMSSPQGDPDKMYDDQILLELYMLKFSVAED